MSLVFAQSEETGGSVASWLNHVAIAAPRNGTTSHVVNPNAGAVVAGTAFTPTAGRLLLCVAAGAVTSGSATGVPTPAPSGWANPANGQAVQNGGLYLWTKTAAGGDTVTAIHNGSNYPVVFDFYEFPAGSSLVKAIAAAGVGNGAAGPTLTGLTAPNWIAAAVNQVHANATAARSVTWSTGVEAVDTSTPNASNTDGYTYSLTYLADSALTSASAASTVAGSGDNSERLVFAVSIPASTGGSSTATGTDTAAGADTGQAAAVRDRTQADPAAAADAGAAARAAARAVDDPAGAADTATVTAERLGELADLGEGLDELAAVVERARQVDDPAGALDVAGAGWARGRSRSDTAAGTDTFTATWARVRTTADLADALDELDVSRAGEGTEQVDDPAAGDDTATTVTSRARALTDAAAAADAVAAVRGREAGTADTALIVDVLQVEWSRVELHADSAAGVDTATAAAEASASVLQSDAATAADTVTVTWARVVVVADAAGGVDRVVVVAGVASKGPWTARLRGRASGSGLADPYAARVGDRGYS